MWHDAAKQWIADDRLVMVGLIQEQHPDRCRLFAQWKQLDFPILWDPFNLTDSKVVPNFIAIDEHGIVRSTRANLETFEAEHPPEDDAEAREAEEEKRKEFMSTKRRHAAYRDVSLPLSLA